MGKKKKKDKITSIKLSKVKSNKKKVGKFIRVSNSTGTRSYRSNAIVYFITRQSLKIGILEAANALRGFTVHDGMPTVAPRKINLKAIYEYKLEHHCDTINIDIDGTIVLKFSKRLFKPSRSVYFTANQKIKETKHYVSFECSIEELIYTIARSVPAYEPITERCLPIFTADTIFAADQSKDVCYFDIASKICFRYKNNHAYLKDIVVL